MDIFNPESTANASLRTPPAAPGSSLPVISSEAPSLLRLQRLSSTLKIYTRSHPTFPSLNTYLNLSLFSAPLARQFFITYIVHGQARIVTPNSCCGMRDPYIWVGIHGQTLEDRNQQEAYAWTGKVVEDLTGAGLMMKGGYVALMGGNEVSKDFFGIIGRG